MNNLVLLSQNVDERVDIAINQAIKTYLTKLSYGMFYDGLEASFQCYLYDAIQKELENIRIYQDECFTVIPKYSVPLNGRKDEIDLAILYKKENIIKKWLIELKYKKDTQGAQDYAIVDSFGDIKDLEEHAKNDKQVSNNYFFFLTDCQIYVNMPQGGTRAELPMYDGAKIKKGKTYMPTAPSTRNRVVGSHYPGGFCFGNDYDIDYLHCKGCNGKDYWYFGLKI